MPDHETPQTRLLRSAGVQSHGVIQRLRDHDIEHIRHIIRTNPDQPGLIVTKLLHGDWSPYDPNPKIFSGGQTCPVCGQPIDICHGIHGPATGGWTNE